MKTYLDDNDFYFYYLRCKPDNTPYGCVALRQDSKGKWSRGISLCSEDDQFVKTKAKKLAKGRCVRAMFRKESSEPIAAQDKDVMNVVGNWFGKAKSGYDIELTEAEARITKSNDKPVFNTDVTKLETAGIAVGEFKANE